MAENVSNNYNNQFLYTNSELQKYDTDNDGSLSVFEIENIQDENAIEILAQELGCMQVADEISTEEQIQNLEVKLQAVKDEQGFIGKTWNALKCLTNLGSSTEKCEKAIEDFKNGEISYEEADSMISKFSTKQKNSVNMVANVATGLAAVVVLGSAVLTGGLSLGIVAAAAGVGAATKAGLKFADRATNKKEGDALDAKQITKDALSGAVDGAVSVATMGLGTTAVTGKTVAQQTIKQTIIQGAKRGAIDGAITGGVTGAADYSIEAALEKDVEFNVKDLAINTAINTAGGALAGGVLGGTSSGIRYKSMQTTLAARQAAHPDIPEDAIVELTDQATKINNNYGQKIGETQSQIEKVFDGDSSISKISGRAKSNNSTFEKLASKYESGKLTTITDASCFDAIADGVGTRLQLTSLSQEQSQKVVNDALKDTGLTYEQFVKYISGDIDGLDEATISALKTNSNQVLNALKETQTKEVFESIKNGIENGSLTITELNNYGGDISSYFTPRQLQEIADVYYQKTGKALDIVTQYDDAYVGTAAKVSIDDNGHKTIQNIDSKIKEKGATKDSGYTSSQMNTKHTFEDGSQGLGELQIRGTEVNDFAEIEHIPYDIRKGKITADNQQYSQIYNLIKGMDDNTYNSYNSYLTEVYNWLRLKELGITTPEPSIYEIMKGANLSEESFELLSRNGLIALSEASH